MTKTVTLWCTTGEHNWERPSQRGKRPLNCPDHAPQKAPSAPLPPEERVARMHEAKAQKIEERKQKNTAEEEILYGHLDAEEQRMISYIDRQVNSGVRNDSDVTLLTTRRKDILRGVRNRIGRVVMT